MKIVSKPQKSNSYTFSHLQIHIADKPSLPYNHNCFCGTNLGQMQFFFRFVWSFCVLHIALCAVQVILSPRFWICAIDHINNPFVRPFEIKRGKKLCRVKTFTAIWTNERCGSFFWLNMVLNLLEYQTPFQAFCQNVNFGCLNIVKIRPHQTHLILQNLCYSYFLYHPREGATWPRRVWVCLLAWFNSVFLSDLWPWNVPGLKVITRCAFCT